MPVARKMVEKDFNPRPPRGGRPGRSAERDQRIHISIHALREEGDLFTLFFTHFLFISIHALREEGDVLPYCSVHIHLLISIHALREEGDCSMDAEDVDIALFQSTPSARRAT